MFMVLPELLKIEVTSDIYVQKDTKHLLRRRRLFIYVNKKAISLSTHIIGHHSAQYNISTRRYVYEEIVNKNYAVSSIVYCFCLFFSSSFNLALAAFKIVRQFPRK